MQHVSLPVCGVRQVTKHLHKVLCDNHNRALVVQGEDEGPGDILDEELQKQLNEIADYDSDDATQPASATGETYSVPCSLTISFYCFHRQHGLCASMQACLSCLY